MTKRLYVERQDDGRYAVKHKNAKRASAVCETQADAIDRAREMNPGHSPDVERVRHTNRGKPDQWRKA
jgi:hypothetical protein